MDIRVAAYAVVQREDGRMLLAHWHEGRHPRWTLPGGGLEPGEDPERAARREVLEETGYSVELQELLGIDSRVIAASDRLSATATGPLHTLRIVYRARVTGGELRNELGGSTDEARWFTLAEVRRFERVALVDVTLRLAGLS